jgi:hypothetical protein
MAITIISSASDEANTITLPTHSAGNLIIILASRLSSNTAISNSDTGLAIAATTATQGQRHTLYRKISQSSSDTVGNFTNAEMVAALILGTDVSGAFVLLNDNVFQSSNLTTVNFGSIPAMGSIALDSRVIGYAGAKNTSADMSVAPTGMTNILTDTVTGQGVIGLHATASGQTSWSAQSATIFGSNVQTSSITFDVFEVLFPIGGGGGIYNPFRPPVFGGGP